jgi:hypothetical protein
MPPKATPKTPEADPPSTPTLGAPFQFKPNPHYHLSTNSPAPNSAPPEPDSSPEPESPNHLPPDGGDTSNLSPRKIVETAHGADQEELANLDMDLYNRRNVDDEQRKARLLAHERRLIDARNDSVRQEESRRRFDEMEEEQRREKGEEEDAAKLLLQLSGGK